MDEASQPSDVERHACGVQTDHGGGEVRMSQQASVTMHLESVIPTVPVPTPSALVSAQGVAPPPLPQPFTAQLWLSGKLPSAQHALQRQNTEISKQIFPEKDYQGLGPNFHIHAFVSDLYIPTVCLFCWRKYVRSLDYINRSQTEECGNWGYSQKRNT